MSSDYEAAAKKVAYRARADQAFARILAADPRRAIEQAWFLSGAEKAAYAASARGAFPLSAREVVALRSLLDARNRSPSFARALDRRGVLALDDASCLSARNRESLLALARARGIVSVRDLALRAAPCRPLLWASVTTEPYSEWSFAPGDAGDAHGVAVNCGMRSVGLPQGRPDLLEAMRRGATVWCREAGTWTRRALEYPCPPPPARDAGHVRPALGAATINLPQGELTARGYPPRPDRRATPDAYANWLDMVRRPARLVEPPPPRLRNPRKRRLGPLVSDTIWAGAVVDPGVVLKAANGTLWIPQAVSMPDTSTYSSLNLWLGVGGASENPGLWFHYVVQAGLCLDMHTIYPNGLAADSRTELVLLGGVRPRHRPWLWTSVCDDPGGDCISSRPHGESEYLPVSNTGLIGILSREISRLRSDHKFARQMADANRPTPCPRRSGSPRRAQVLRKGRPASARLCSRARWRSIWKRIPHT